MLARFPAIVAFSVVVPAMAAFAQTAPPANPAPAPAPVTAPASDGAVFYTAPLTNTDWLSSSFLNKAVYGPNDERLGKITDLIMTQDGHVLAAVVGVGGFLGIGEKDVAVSFDALKVKTKNNSPYLSLNVTKDALKSAPKFVKPARRST